MNFVIRFVIIIIYSNVSQLTFSIADYVLLGAIPSNSANILDCDELDIQTYRCVTNRKFEVKSCSS